jgi:RNA polymerase sigma-70 factor (ECF subfamily)
MDSEKLNNNLQNPKILKLDDDFSLVKRFVDGDKSSFRILVQRHKEKIRNIIYLTVNNSDLVDDIAQEVFITVYRNLKNFRFESQFTTWLYRITVNKCKDHLRKIYVRKIFVPVNEAEEYSGENFSVESDNISEIVMNAVNKLPVKLRIPLILKDIEGFSYQEIAESVQCEIGTVKSRIFRAREGLKKILGPIESELK